MRPVRVASRHAAATPAQRSLRLSTALRVFLTLALCAPSLLAPARETFGANHDDAEKSSAAIAAEPMLEPTRRPSDDGTDAHAGRAQTRPLLEYLHVEANEGGASGGHVALRFGAQVYHFQFHDGRILRLHREDALAFVHTYARLQNRHIHAQRLDVSAETYELLRRRFADRFVLEARQFAILDALRADRDLLAAIARAEPAALSLRGAGLFSDDGGAPDGRDSDALGYGPSVATVTTDRSVDLYGTRSVALDGNGAGDRVADARLARRQRAIEEAIARLGDADPGGGDLAGDAVRVNLAASPHIYAATPDSLAERATELLEARRALAVIRDGATLRPDAVRAAALPELALSPDESEALRRLATDLEQQIATLVESSRPDFGRVLLLAAARHAVVVESVRRGSLVVLDAYPADATTLSPDEVRAHAALLPELLSDARDDLVAARRALRPGASLRESEYTRLESATNRFLELDAAATRGAPLRLASGPMLPARPANATLPQRTVEPERLDAHLRIANARLDAYDAELRARYAYDLLTRNCVSEIFHEIAAALADGRDRRPDDDDGDDLACGGSTVRLGGCVDPASRLRFIPFVSASAVADEYRVEASRELPSYRTERLAEMYARENDLAVFLRESNVLTSTVYTPQPEDSPFLFFTDDAPLLRPLFGTANLLTALGATAAGVLALPLGNDELVMQGLRGALFSVPELGFVSLRKGSFAYAPRITAEVGGHDDDDARPGAMQAAEPRPLSEPLVPDGAATTKSRAS